MKHNDGNKIEIPREVWDDALSKMPAGDRDKLQEHQLKEEIAKVGVIGRTKQLLKSPLGMGAGVALASTVLPIGTPVAAALKLAVANPLTTAAVVGGAAAVDHAVAIPKRLERQRLRSRKKKQPEGAAGTAV